MRLHHKLYGWLQANPAKVDLITTLLAFAVLALPFLAADPVSFVLSAALVAPQAWRRTRPAASGALVAAACLVHVLVLDEPVPSQVLALATVYSLAAYAPRWASLGGLALALFGGILFVLEYWAGAGAAGAAGLPVLTIGVVAINALVLAAWSFGDLARTRQLAVRALEDRARRLEVERQQERELAAADERNHIAREMHDIVAHSLSVIITQADGARYASAQDPAVAGATLATIADTGRSSLRDMRRLLGVLRGDETASTRPLPSLADLETLVDTVRRSGLDVGYLVQGAPGRPLPAGAELTAYRVVQEALTNVLKHAGPAASAAVRL
ncbi:sensor histidine kinase, partial [Arthrobacter deserti]|nr:sensor histidine kinase [Arthrobacter deserti]